MTTIHLSHASQRNDGQYQVFGSYEGSDDRYVFGVRAFDRLEDAEQAAKRMMAKYEADHFRRTL